MQSGSIVEGVGPGQLKDKMGNDFYAVLFLALLSVLAVVLIMGHNSKAEYGASPRPA